MNNLISAMTAGSNSLNSVLRNMALTLTTASLIGACSPGADQQKQPKSETSQVTTQTQNTSDWKMVADESGMTYITIKNGEFAEINTFRQVSGTVSHKGDAEILVDLSSVDTNNEIRDERLRELLFKTHAFPQAKITAKIDMAPLESLAIGESHTLLLDMTIAVRGVSVQKDFYVLATRLGADKVVVNNKAPLILEAADFGMTEAIEQLRTLASLDSITPLVTATVSFTFER